MLRFNIAKIVTTSFSKKNGRDRILEIFHAFVLIFYLQILLYGSILKARSAVSIAMNRYHLAQSLLRTFTCQADVMLAVF